MSSIRLQPWQDSDWSAVWRWCQRFWWQIADDFTPRDEAGFVAMQIARQAVNLGVWRDGQLGGLLTWERLNPIVCQAHCVFSREFWGRETTLPAIEAGLTTLWMSGYTKMIAPVYRSNRRMQVLLEQLNARCEAVLINHTRQQGKPTTVLLYGIDGGLQ